jgi:hypothetical protein
MKGELTVYYVMSDGRVESGIVKQIEDRGRVIRFLDDGWNPTADCYLMPQQARRARGIPEPQPKLRKATTRAIALIRKALDLLESQVGEDGCQQGRSSK